MFIRFAHLLRVTEDLSKRVMKPLCAASSCRVRNAASDESWGSCEQAKLMVRRREVQLQESRKGNKHDKASGLLIHRASDQGRDNNGQSRSSDKCHTWALSRNGRSDVVPKSVRIQWSITISKVLGPCQVVFLSNNPILSPYQGYSSMQGPPFFAHRVPCLPLRRPWQTNAH